VPTRRHGAFHGLMRTVPRRPAFTVGQPQGAAFEHRVSGGDVNPYLRCWRRAGGRYENEYRKDGAEPPAPITGKRPMPPNCRKFRGDGNPRSMPFENSEEVKHFRPRNGAEFHPDQAQELHILQENLTPARSRSKSNLGHGVKTEALMKIGILQDRPTPHNSERRAWRLWRYVRQTAGRAYFEFRSGRWSMATSPRSAVDADGLADLPDPKHGAYEDHDWIHA